MEHRHRHETGWARAGAETDRRRLGFALALLLSLLVAEVAVGILANSLALLSDAGHMLTDVAALALSLFAIGLAATPAQGAMTYGFKRVEILAAQVNGITLLVLALLILYEAIGRLITPPQVAAGWMLAVALAGIVVNVAAARTLAGASRESLNIEGSFRHIVTDLYAFIGTAIAAILILTTGYMRADAIASLLIAVLMLRSAYVLLRESGRVFLEAAPAALDPEQIGDAMARLPGVVEIHDLHVWEVTSGFPSLSAHVIVGAQSDCHEVRERLAAMLRERFAIEHTTLQTEHEGGRLLSIERPA
ncbi:MAG TPA: cation diffusion facilitator family transporter [Solirubrobacteraceae bacterium]|nr:cation diffusion facilitator family transporter [Solirubrobacteraceae bacterium]